MMLVFGFALLVLFLAGCLAIAWRRGRRRSPLRSEDERALWSVPSSAAESILRIFFDGSPQMMGVAELLDDDIRHLVDNSATGRFFGVHPSMIAGRTATSLGSSREHVALWINKYREAERLRAPVTFEYEHGAVDRPPRVLAATVSYIGASPAGRPIFSYTVTDATEQKATMLRLKDALAEAESLRERLTLALQASQVGVWDWNVADDGLQWDERMRDLYGVADEHFSGRVEDWKSSLAPEDLPRLEEEIRQALEGVREYDTEFRIRRRKDGELRHMRAFGLVQRDSSGKPLRMIGVNWDITKEKADEAELRRAKEQAMRAAQAKSEFLANMSHEIRTPMNGVLGMCRLLLASGANPAQVEKLRVIEQSGDALMDLIDSVLDLSKLEAGKLEIEKRTFSPAVVLREVDGLFRALAEEKGLVLTTEIDASVPPLVVGDPVRFRQILSNLLSNAVKFTEGGGVRVHASSSRLEDGSCEILAFVSDSGVGIAPDAGERLFEPFAQEDASTTRRFGGTGLGLAISKALCEKMGGRIWLKSENGEGSTFFFTVRAEDASRLAKARASAGESALALSGFALRHPRRILIAEDNRANQMVLAGMLESLGYEAQVAATGREAFEAVRRGDFDLVLMDCHMPEMDGFEACERIRSQPEIRQPKIVAVTASAMARDLQRCFAAGMDAVVAKPISFEAIMNAIAPGPSLASAVSDDAVAALKPEPAREPAEPFDEAAFWRRFGGLESLALGVAQEALRAYRPMLSEIRSAVAAEDGMRLEIAAHAFKGLVANFHARDARRLAEALEALAQSRDFSAAHRATAELEREADRLAEALRSLTEGGRAWPKEAG